MVDVVGGGGGPADVIICVFAIKSCSKFDMCISFVLLASVSEQRSPMRSMTAFTIFGSSMSLDELLSSVAAGNDDDEGIVVLHDEDGRRVAGDAVELLVDVTFGRTASKSAALISCKVSSLESESLESVPSPLLVEPPRDACKREINFI